MVAPFLDMPTSACSARVTYTLSRAVGMDGSPFTMEEQFFKWVGERWIIDVIPPPYTDETIAQEWISFLLKLEGMYGTFLMGPPAKAVPRGVGGGSPQVDGGSQTGKTLGVKNAPAGVTGWLLDGDYFQLGTGTGSRLHRLTANADTNGSGEVDLEFVPALRSSPADSAAITILNPRGRFRLDSNDTSWSEEPGIIYRTGFRAFEVL